MYTLDNSFYRRSCKDIHGYVVCFGLMILSLLLIRSNKK